MLGLQPQPDVACWGRNNQSWRCKHKTVLQTPPGRSHPTEQQVITFEEAKELERHFEHLASC